MRTQPRWQQYPVSETSPYNWDGFQYKALANAWDAFQQQQQVVMSYVNNIPTNEDPDLNVEERNQFIGDFVRNNNNNNNNNDSQLQQQHTEPFGDIFYPIIPFDDGHVDTDDIILGSSSSVGNDNDNDNDNKLSTTNDVVVGVVAVTFYWRDLLKNMLSDEIDGMHVVVENNCNQTFTYTWLDSEPLYLGMGDLHEPEFDELKQSFSFTDTEESDMYTGLPLSSGGCQYVIHFYPSTDMLRNFENNQVR